MIIPGGWFVEPVTIESYRGQGAYGDVYADPVTVLGHVSGGSTTSGGRIQAGAQGEELVAESRVMLPNPARLADGSGAVDPADVLRTQSRITAGAITATAVAVSEHRQPGSGRLVYVSGSLG